MFQVLIEDALDHGTVVDAFDTLEEAKACYDNCLKIGAEGYELSITLERIIGDYEDFEELFYHEWFSQEEWEAMHPGGFPELWAEHRNS